MSTLRRIALAGDHAAVEMKAELVALVTQLGFEAIDLGTNSRDSVDYPNIADALAAAIAQGKADCGVLLCGTGIGISIAANRHRHIRAALCHDTTDARLARQHNDANVLVMGARTTGIEVVKDCLGTFLRTEFEGGRHARRVALLG